MNFNFGAGDFCHPCKGHLLGMVIVGTLLTEGQSPRLLAVEARQVLDFMHDAAKSQRAVSHSNFAPFEFKEMVTTRTEDRVYPNSMSIKRASL